MIQGMKYYHGGWLCIPQIAKKIRRFHLSSKIRHSYIKKGVPGSDTGRITWWTKQCSGPWNKSSYGTYLLSFPLNMVKYNWDVLNWINFVSTFGLQTTVKTLLIVCRLLNLKGNQRTIREKKTDDYAKTLAKIHVTANFLMHARYAEKLFTQIYRELHGDAMLVPIQMGPLTWRPETSRNISQRVLQQKREFISRGTQKH